MPQGKYDPLISESAHPHLIFGLLRKLGMRMSTLGLFAQFCILNRDPKKVHHKAYLILQP